ncbi:MAG: hypothetical protein LBG15_01185 [Dysgonamonadaceae bacterium]|jgi:hypothetical protein|nr:hypothetical protein [Dysgonamonadaceae bacterium]
MSLRDYIQGRRKGRDINRLERRAMQDMLLADALDGYDKIKGDHICEIEELQKQISQRTHSKNNDLRNWGIVACLLLIIILGSYLFLKDTQYLSDEYIVVRSKEPEINLQVPPKEDIPVTANENTGKMGFSSPKETDQLPEFIPEPNETFIDKNSIAEQYLSKEDTNRTDLTINSIDFQELQLIAKAENESQTDKTAPDISDLQKTQSPIAPEPVIGNYDYEIYLKRNVVIPADSDCKNVKGNVILSFYVNENGRPFGMNVKQSLCPTADEEAIRLIREGPDWTTGSNEVEIEVKF